jgi:hypothetical protein
MLHFEPLRDPYFESAVNPWATMVIDLHWADVPMQTPGADAVLKKKDYTKSQH